MSFQAMRSGDMLHVTVPGPRLDAAAVPVFKQWMNDATARHSGDVVLDLGEITFIDSSGLGAIVGIARRLPKGRSLSLDNVAPPVMRLLRLTRVDTVFTIRESVAGGNA
ncbi:MAG: STAS domain-containing protein [Pseudomonadota bacterium]